MENKEKTKGKPRVSTTKSFVSFLFFSFFSLFLRCQKRLFDVILNLVTEMFRLHLCYLVESKKKRRRKKKKQTIFLDFYFIMIILLFFFFKMNRIKDNKNSSQ